MRWGSVAPCSGWCGRARTDRAVAFALASATCFVQLFGFVSDAALGSTNLVANVASTLVLAAGWGLVLSAHFTGRKSPVI